jgi:hypothetical protein
MSLPIYCDSISPEISPRFSTVLNSNSGNPTGHYLEAALNHTYDFANYHYYIRVDMNHRQYHCNTPATMLHFS